MGLLEWCGVVCMWEWFGEMEKEEGREGKG